MASPGPSLPVPQARTFPWAYVLQSRASAEPIPTHVLPEVPELISCTGCFLLAMAMTQGFMTALADRPALNVQA